jgi:hypothetical protein
MAGRKSRRFKQLSLSVVVALNGRETYHLSNYF